MASSSMQYSSTIVDDQGDDILVKFATCDHVALIDKVNHQRYVSIIECPTCRHHHKIMYVNTVRTIIESLTNTPFMLLTSKHQHGMKPAYTTDNMAPNQGTHILYSPAIKLYVSISTAPPIGEIVSIVDCDNNAHRDDNDHHTIIVYYSRSHKKLKTGIINVVHDIILKLDSASNASTTDSASTDDSANTDDIDNIVNHFYREYDKVINPYRYKRRKSILPSHFTFEDCSI